MGVLPLKAPTVPITVNALLSDFSISASFSFLARMKCLLRVSPIWSLYRSPLYAYSPPV